MFCWSKYSTHFKFKESPLTFRTYRPHKRHAAFTILVSVLSIFVYCLYNAHFKISQLFQYKHTIIAIAAIAIPSFKRRFCHYLCCTNPSTAAEFIPSSVTREFTFMNRDYAVKCVCVIGCCFAIHHSQCSRLTAGNKFRMLGDFCNTDGDEQIGI